MPYPTNPFEICEQRPTRDNPRSLVEIMAVWYDVGLLFNYLSCGVTLPL
jgi:hypothetical protein